MAEYQLTICDMGMGPHRRMWPALAAFNGAKRQRADAIRLQLERAVYEYFEGVARLDSKPAWDATLAARSLKSVRRGYVFEVKTSEITFSVYRLA